MAHRLILLLVLGLAGSPMQGTALILPTQTTTSTPASLDTDEPFTTKRSANLYVELTVTQMPLKVENSEVELKKMTAAATGTEATSRPASTKPPTTAKPTLPPRRSSPEMPLYRLNGSNGQACILLQVDALITIWYKTKIGEKGEANIYVPDGATVTGSCDSENFVIMSLKWDAFVLSWSFAKTPGGERWYVEKIELTYNSSDRHFEHIEQPRKTIRLSSAQKHSSMLFPTPVGKSYFCEGEQIIPLSDGKNQGSILLRDMKLQPFKFKNNDFAAEFSCAALSARANRDETAPVAVGSTLAAAVLLTITGYAGWRYFKVKKVKYDTME